MEMTGEAVGRPIEESWLSRIRRQPLWARAGLLVATLVLNCAISLGVSSAITKENTAARAPAALAALGIALLGLTPALWLAEKLSRSQRPLSAVFAPMLARMGVPLSAALALKAMAGESPDGPAGRLISHGTFHFLILFYLIGLAVETMLVAFPKPVSGPDNRAR